MTTSDVVKDVLYVLKSAQVEARGVWKPPPAGSPALGSMVIYSSLVSNTRPYIEQIAHQINGCYEHGWYDASAVMIRRFIETLIIEAFEHHEISDRIKDSNGDFRQLSHLIDHTLGCEAWNLGRNTKQALRCLKGVGDRSAHSRRFLAHRPDIDKISSPLRDVTQELLMIAGLK